MKNQIAFQEGDGNIQNNFWTERRRWLVAICAAILVVVSVSASIVVYLLQPDRAVAEQHAIDADREGKDSATPPARPESIVAPPGGPGSLASSRPLELEGATWNKAVKDSVPDGVALGIEALDGAGKFITGSGTGVMYFKLTGRNFTPVQISNITAKVVERRRPPTGTIVPFYPQGVTEALAMGFDFRSGDIVEAKVLSDRGEVTELDYVRVHAMTLALNEALAFEIELRAQDCDCRFVVDVGFTDGRSLTIDDGGEPFRFATMAASYERAYVPMFQTNNPNSILRSCDYPLECRRKYGQMDTK
ncbi:hypothetical protein [Nocardia sp. NPDC057455]|uniref:hypothetical protein n=1 Tax=Nocardia sp. NPDC057455 TaxID=3346138 RepID=UPI00366C878C